MWRQQMHRVGVTDRYRWTDTHIDGRQSDPFTCFTGIMTKERTNKTKKSRGVCETLQYAPGGNKVEKAISSFKVKVKVTRSLTLVSFERASLVEYACQI